MEMAVATNRSGAPRVSTARGHRTTRVTYHRRRIAVLGMALGLVLVAAQAGAALGGSPLAAPERRPTSASRSGVTETVAGTVAVVVRPGDTLWAIAERLAPGEDPRPAVDLMTRARHGAPLVPGETLVWPR